MKQYQRMLMKAGVTLGALAMPFMVLAAPGQNPFINASANINTIQQQSGVKATDLPTLVGNIINAVLGILGLVLLIYLIYGGFLWMTAGGDSKGVDKAKTMITNAIIGLVVIMAAVAISQFVISSLQTATS